MRNRVLVLLLVLCLPALFRAGPGDVSYIRAFIPGEEEGSYGLGKLTATERGRLEKLFQTITARLDNRLQNSALAYLRKEGWTEVEVTGAETAVLVEAAGEEQFVAVMKAGTRYLLEPVTSSSFVVGEYLGRVSGAAFEVIGADGTAAMYRVRKVEPPGEKE